MALPPRGDATTSDGRLTRKILTGDRVKVKPELVMRYLGVYQFNPDEIREVIRIDHVQNGERLYVEGAPFMFWKSDCELAWNGVAERREGLRKAGWTA